MRIAKSNVFLRAIAYTAIVLTFFLSVWFALTYKSEMLRIRSVEVFYASSFCFIILVSSIRLRQKHDRVLVFMILSLLDLIFRLAFEFVPISVENSTALFYVFRFIVFHSAMMPFAVNVLAGSRYFKSNGALYGISLVMSVVLLTFVHPSVYSDRLSVVIVVLFYLMAHLTMLENMQRLFYVVSSTMRKVNILSSFLFFIFITLRVSGFSMQLNYAGLFGMIASYAGYYFTSLRM